MTERAQKPEARVGALWRRVAVHLGVKLKSKRFRIIEQQLPLDSSSPDFTYDPNKCVLCGKCVWICRNRLGIGVLGFAHRGFRRMVTTFDNRPIAESNCQGCDDCVVVCPVGALSFKDESRIETSPGRQKAKPAR